MFALGVVCGLFIGVVAGVAAVFVFGNEFSPFR